MTGDNVDQTLFRFAPGFPCRPSPGASTPPAASFQATSQPTAVLAPQALAWAIQVDGLHVIVLPDLNAVSRTLQGHVRRAVIALSRGGQLDARVQSKAARQAS